MTEEQDGIMCEDGYTLIYAFRGTDGLEHLKDRIIRSLRDHAYNTEERDDILKNGVLIVKIEDWEGSHFEIRTPIEYAFDLENRKKITFIEYITPSWCQNIKMGRYLR